jgi:hypothetical protein
MSRRRLRFSGQDRFTILRDFVLECWKSKGLRSEPSLTSSGCIGSLSRPRGLRDRYWVVEEIISHIPSSIAEDTDEGYVRRITPILHKFWRRSRCLGLFRILFRTSLWRTNVYYEQVVCYYEHSNRLINFVYSPVRRIKVRMPIVKVSPRLYIQLTPLLTL